MHDRRRTRAPLAAALLGAAGISFSAVFFRLADVSPTTGGLFRMVYALPLLALAAWWRREDDTRPPRQRLLALGTGAFLALDIVTWHASIDLIGAGLATLVVNSQVVIVPLATWLLFRERPASAALWAMPVVMVGVALVTGLGRGDAFGARPILGMTLAVVAAAFYSTFLITYRRVSRTPGVPVGALLEASTGAAVAILLAGLVDGSLDLVPSWPEHLWLAALALVSQVVAWLAIGYALPRLPAAHTSFAVLLQPTLTLVWGRLLFGERASWVQLIGVGLVLAGILTVTLGSRQRLPAQPPL